MKILITGGAGFIGTHLVKRLADENHEIRILDKLLAQVHGDDPALDLPAECELIRGDVRDLPTVMRAVKDADIVYHLAAETGVGQSQYEIERYVATNTHGTAVVLQAAANANVQQVIITSSRAVYGEGVHICPLCDKRFAPLSRERENLDRGLWEVFCPNCGNPAEAQLMNEKDPPAPTSVYGLTKLQQEQLAKQVGPAYELPITILRLFNVFGPGQSLGNPYVGVLGTFFRQITAGGGIDIYEDGKMLRDFVYVADVVEVLCRTASNTSAYDKIINVGTGTGVTLAEAGENVFRALKKEPKMGFSGKYRFGDIHHAISDTSGIDSILNYRPPTRFQEGLHRFVEWALVTGYIGTSIDSAAEIELTEKNLLRQSGR